jgi:hypothetical protein
MRPLAAGLTAATPCQSPALAAEAMTDRLDAVIDRWVQFSGFMAECVKTSIAVDKTLLLALYHAPLGSKWNSDHDNCKPTRADFLPKPPRFEPDAPSAEILDLVEPASPRARASSRVRHRTGGPGLAISRRSAAFRSSL